MSTPDRQSHQRDIDAPPSANSTQLNLRPPYTIDEEHLHRQILSVLSNASNGHFESAAYSNLEREHIALKNTNVGLVNAFTTQRVAEKFNTLGKNEQLRRNMELVDYAYQLELLLIRAHRGQSIFAQTLEKIPEQYRPQMPQIVHLPSRLYASETIEHNRRKSIEFLQAGPSRAVAPPNGQMQPQPQQAFHLSSATHQMNGSATQVVPAPGHDVTSQNGISQPVITGYYPPDAQPLLAAPGPPRSSLIDNRQGSLVVRADRQHRVHPVPYSRPAPRSANNLSVDTNQRSPVGSYPRQHPLSAPAAPSHDVPSTSRPVPSSVQDSVPQRANRSASAPSLENSLIPPSVQNAQIAAQQLLPQQPTMHQQYAALRAQSPLQRRHSSSPVVMGVRQGGPDRVVQTSTPPPSQPHTPLQPQLVPQPLQEPPPVPHQPHTPVSDQALPARPRSTPHASAAQYHPQPSQLPQARVLPQQELNPYPKTQAQNPRQLPVYQRQQNVQVTPSQIVPSQRTTEISGPMPHNTQTQSVSQAAPRQVTVPQQPQASNQINAPNWNQAQLPRRSTTNSTSPQTQDVVHWDQAHPVPQEFARQPLQAPQMVRTAQKSPPLQQQREYRAQISQQSLQHHSQQPTSGVNQAQPHHPQQPQPLQFQQPQRALHPRPQQPQQFQQFQPQTHRQSQQVQQILPHSQSQHQHPRLTQPEQPPQAQQSQPLPQHPQLVQPQPRPQPQYPQPIQSQQPPQAQQQQHPQNPHPLQYQQSPQVPQPQYYQPLQYQQPPQVQQAQHPQNTQALQYQQPPQAHQPQHSQYPRPLQYQHWQPPQVVQQPCPVPQPQPAQPAQPQLHQFQSPQQAQRSQPDLQSQLPQQVEQPSAEQTQPPEVQQPQASQGALPQRPQPLPHIQGHPETQEEPPQTQFTHGAPHSEQTEAPQQQTPPQSSQASQQNTVTPRPQTPSRSQAPITPTEKNQDAQGSPKQLESTQHRTSQVLSVTQASQGGGAIIYTVPVSRVNGLVRSIIPPQGGMQTSLASGFASIQVTGQKRRRSEFTEENHHSADLTIQTTPDNGSRPVTDLTEEDLDSQEERPNVQVLNAQSSDVQMVDALTNQPESRPLVAVPMPISLEQQPSNSALTVGQSDSQGILPVTSQETEIAVNTPQVSQLESGATVAMPMPIAIEQQPSDAELAACPTDNQRASPSSSWETETTGGASQVNQEQNPANCPSESPPHEAITPTVSSEDMGRTQAPGMKREMTPPSAEENVQAKREYDDVVIKKEQDDDAMEVDELADDISEEEADDEDWGDLTTDTEDEPVASVMECVARVFIDDDEENGVVRKCMLCNLRRENDLQKCAERGISQNFPPLPVFTESLLSELLAHVRVEHHRAWVKARYNKIEPLPPDEPDDLMT